MAQIDNSSICCDTDLMGRDADDSERHALLRATVGSVLKDSGGPGRIRQLRGQLPGYDKQLWKKMADLGWLGTTVPEAFGGLGLGIRDMCVVVHESGKWVAPEPLVASAVLASGALWRGDNDSLKAEFLPRAVNGDLSIGLAWQEAVGDIDFANPALTRATHTGSQIKINGRKTLVHGGSDAFIVSAQSDHGLSAYWVPAGAQGLTITPTQMADGTFTSELTFTDTHIPASSVVAYGSSASAALGSSIDEAMVGASAELLGIMDAVLQQTIDYLCTRVQFERPIGEFQALQHRVVDLFMAKELASCALTDAIQVFESDADPARRSEAAMRAKYRASRSAAAITRAAVHLHGAIGFTDEFNIGLYLKRSIVLGSWLGNSDLLLQKLSNESSWLSRAWHQEARHE
jgi:alkylation response protein AidB-like acyl-CoA dehydrogenase